jgi:hypothetical protein
VGCEIRRGESFPEVTEIRPGRVISCSAAAVESVTGIMFTGFRWTRIRRYISVTSPTMSGSQSISLDTSQYSPLVGNTHGTSGSSGLGTGYPGLGVGSMGTGSPGSVGRPMRAYSSDMDEDVPTS